MLTDKQVTDLNEAVENYIARHKITFVMQAGDDDGEVILKETSKQSFNDVAMFASLLDDRLENMVIDDENARSDDRGY